MAKIIDGKAFAANLREKIKLDVDKLKSVHNLTPGLAVVLVGEDPASQVYVRNKARQTEEAGMKSIEHRLPATTTQEELMAMVEQLNNDNDIHGILVQLPLPKGLDDKAVINAINVAKDVDGFHIENVGKLSVGEKSLVPCTPLGCLMLLQDHLGDLSGKNAVIIGRSNIVGKPMANLLLQNNCTVTIVHSRTQNIKEICQQADIVVAAVGQAEMVDASWLKKDAVVIDVGINRIDKEDGKTKIVGDVNFNSASEVASAITPVPGGVGPMTIACLLYNTVQAAARQKKHLALDFSNPCKVSARSISHLLCTL